MRLKYFIILVVLIVNGNRCFSQEPNRQPIFYHEQKGSSEQFIEDLSYEAPLALDFDKKNRPYIINNTLVGHNIKNGVYQITTLRNNRWVNYSYKDELIRIFGDSLYINKDDEAYQGHNASRSCQLMIDDNDNLIALIDVMFKKTDGKITRRSIVLYASNIGRDDFKGDFIIKDVIPADSRMAKMETRNSFNGNEKYAPLLTFLRPQQNFPYNTPSIWAQKSYNRAYILNGYFDRGNLIFAEPVLLDTNIPGFTKHSGGENFAVTIGKYAFVTYTRHDSDPNKDPDGNNAGYVKKFNRKSNKFESERKFLFDATPSFADGHSVPVIAVDKDGYLYIQSGAHANNPTGPFISTRSTKKLDITAWEEIKNIGSNRTYSSLLFDSSGKKHSFFRSGSPYKLWYQVEDIKKGYANDNGKLFVDQNSKVGYRVYYHHVYMDKKNRVFISWTPNSGADYKTWDFRRVLAMSDDNGQTWEIVTKQDFIDEIVK